MLESGYGRITSGDTMYVHLACKRNLWFVTPVSVQSPGLFKLFSIHIVWFSGWSSCVGIGGDS